MKTYFYLTILLLFGCYKQSDSNRDQNGEKTPMENHFIDSLENRITKASLLSIKEQIDIGYNELGQLDKLTSLIDIINAKDGLRNNFLRFIQDRDEFKNGFDEMYLIEAERSGEVFEAWNILYFSDKDIGHKYSYERGKWILAENVKFNFRINDFFEDLKYRAKCKEGDYASMDYLSISRIKNDNVFTKIFIVICAEDIPKELRRW